MQKILKGTTDKIDFAHVPILYVSFFSIIHGNFGYLCFIIFCIQIRLNIESSHEQGRTTFEQWTVSMETIQSERNDDVKKKKKYVNE